MANKQPSLGQWLKLFWLDLLTMAVLGGIGLGVGTHMKPVLLSGSWLNYV